MMKPRHAKLLAAAMAFGLVFVCSVPSSAQTKFMEAIRRKYQMDKTNGKCELCHEVKPKEEPSRKNLNVFGKQIQDDPAMKPLLGKDDKYEFSKSELKILEGVVEKMELEDLDKDGFNNVEELELGSMPWDPKSVPDARRLKMWQKQNPAKSSANKKK
jgi:hypothetical protein